MWAILVTVLLIVVAFVLFFIKKKKVKKYTIDNNECLRLAEVVKANTNETYIADSRFKLTDEDLQKIAESSLALNSVGCLCGGPCKYIGDPCFKCGKPCTYQPTVNGRPLYRCEWRVLQNGPYGYKERSFVRELRWYWTCSVCGMEPMESLYETFKK